MQFDPRLVLQAAKSAARREAERASHPNRDRLAMHKPCSLIQGEALERMAKGMAEIEQRPFALLMLVARDNRRLGLAARRNRMHARGSPREDRAPIGFQPGEESRVANEAIFDNFGIASAKFARRQCFKRICVRDNKRRLMEGADQILAMTGVDPGLAALRR